MRNVSKLVGVDWSNLKYTIKSTGRRMPRWESFEYELKDIGVDILETVIAIQQRVPEDDSSEAIASVALQTRNLTTALQRSTAARVIVCPAKRKPEGDFKQSDDQRLMITTLSLCLRLKPDFLTLFAADGDYAPMVWELRENGIRTEVVGMNIAGELAEAAYHTVDLGHLLDRIEQKEAA